MNNKRKLFLIQFTDCYEVWLAKSKDSLIEKYQNTSKLLTGLDFEEDSVECKEISLEGIFRIMDGDVDMSMIESDYNRLVELDEDVLFFTNFI